MITGTTPDAEALSRGASQVQVVDGSESPGKVKISTATSRSLCGLCVPRTRLPKRYALLISGSVLAHFATATPISSMITVLFPRTDHRCTVNALAVPPNATLPWQRPFGDGNSRIGPRYTLKRSPSFIPSQISRWLCNVLRDNSCVGNWEGLIASHLALATSIPMKSSIVYLLNM